MEHCSPSMETKLQSMVGFEDVVDEQDSLKLIKLLWKAYFEQDGTKQAILEIVEANKRLMLCWQKPGMSIDTYTREFKACIEVCEAVGSGIGISGPSTKLACNAAGLDHEALNTSVEGDKIAQLNKMDKAGRLLYFVALNFKGLNKGRYDALQKRVP